MTNTALTEGMPSRQVDVAIAGALELKMLSYQFTAYNTKAEF